MQERRSTFAHQPSFAEIEDGDFYFDEKELDLVPRALPFSDFKRFLMEGSIFEEVLKNPQFTRLEGVKSLSLISSHSDHNERADYFKQDRSEHDIMVGLISGEIGRLNGFPQEKVTLLELSGVLHDIKTPALGDAAKKVDPKALNEEKNLWNYLDKRTKAFLRKNGGHKKELEEIIENRGIDGDILDKADRIVYTMIDLDRLSDKLGGPLSDPKLVFIRDFVDYNPKIGNIYKEVGADQRKNEVFFNNPQNLAKFLLIRALLYRDLYLNPVNQGRDLFIMKLISPLYSRRGDSLLTPADLCEMQDEDLLRIISKNLVERYGSVIERQARPYTLSDHLINWLPEYKKCDNEKQAKALARELSKQKDIAVIGVRECKGFNPATGYKVVSSGVNIVPFETHMPKEANELKQIAESTKGFFVHYTTLSDDNPLNDILNLTFKQNDDAKKNR